MTLLIHIYEKDWAWAKPARFLCGATDPLPVTHNIFEDPLHNTGTETVCEKCIEILGPLRTLAATEL